MVLGSTYEFTPLVRRAQDRGIYVVACDGFAEGPAKDVADARYDVSVYDHDAVAEVCRAERVDGIITAFSDNLAEQCAAIAERAQVPFYLPPSRLAVLRDKSRMKAMFHELGIAYPKTVVARRGTLLEDLAPLRFPVVTKPLSGWGSHGVLVLDDAGQVAERFDEVAGTGSDAILVEEYNDGFELNAMTWAVGGEPVVLEVADREKTPGAPHAIPHVSRIVYPSVLEDRVLDEVRDIAGRVMRHVGLQDGPLCMQLFWSPGRGIQVCECAGRVFGTEHEMLEYTTNGRLTVEDLLLDTAYDHEGLARRLAGHDPHLERVACGLFFHGREGTIARMEGVPTPQVMPGCADTLCYYGPGDTIRAGAQPYVMRTYLAADARAEIDAMTDEVFANFDVRDAAGASLLYRNRRASYDRAFGA